MDDPPSEGHEPVADIYIISADEPVTVQIREHLEKNDYRVRVFSDKAQLNEALTTGKPDLLIYGIKTGDRDGYEVISRIKADKNLSGMPIVVLTPASTMDDLLSVLEANADNFIGPPYTLPDNLSLITGMLRTPIGPPAADEKIRQFRVRQDDQTYVVAATGIKLLEYLLSSFDMVINTSSELSSATTKLLEISGSARDLEQRLNGQTREIGTLKEFVRQNEERIGGLVQESGDLKRALAQKTEEVRNLSIALDNKKTSLDTVENALKEEEARSALLEQTVQDLRSELGLQKSALAEEKNRAISAEEEISTLTQAKTRSEQDMGQVINGLNETIRQHLQEMDLLKDELQKEVNLRVMAETQAGSLQQELKNSGNYYQSEIGALNRQVAKLQESLTASAAALETERELRIKSEEKTGVLVQQMEDLEKKACMDGEEKERVTKDQDKVIGQIRENLEVARQRIQSLETEISNLASEKFRREQDIGILNAELDHAKSLLAEERKGHQPVNDGDAGAWKDRHMVQQSLFKPDKEITRKEDLDLVVTGEPQLPVRVEPGPQSMISVEEVAGPGHGPAGLKAAVEDKNSTLNPPEQPATTSDPGDKPGSPDEVTKQPEIVQVPDRAGNNDVPGISRDEAPGAPGEAPPGDDSSFSSRQWFNLIRWAHHSEAITQEQKQKIIRMGRMIQKDRKLTKKQQEQVREIMTLVKSLGYQTR